MLTWDTAQCVGIPFEWANLNARNRRRSTFGDATTTSYRLNYLRGDPATRSTRPAPVYIAPATPSSAISWIRAPPGWVRPLRRTRSRGRIVCTRLRRCRRTAARRLICSSRPPNRHGSTSCMWARTTALCTASDAGSFDALGNFVANGTTPNDGQEVLGLPAGIELAEQRRGLGHRRLHRRCEHSNGGARHSWCDAGRRRERGMHGTGARLLQPAIRSQLLRGRDARARAICSSAANGTPGSSAALARAAPPSMRSMSRTPPPATSPKAMPPSIVIGEWNAAIDQCTNVANCGINLGQYLRDAANPPSPQRQLGRYLRQRPWQRIRATAGST